jgi:hypothetical protein
VKIKECEMSGTCNTHGRDEKCMQRDNLIDLVINGRVILK